MLKSIAAALVLVSSGAIAQDQPAPPPQPQEIPTPEKVMEMLDANKDGFIVREEAKGPLVEYFDIVDFDKDGKISHAELKAAMDAMQQR
jgi:EF hand